MSGEPGIVNPYVGLRPFGQDDSPYFFGRREQTAELLESLHRTHFLAVVGSSGCGKSSLVRAGLIPALLGGFLVEERDRWRIAAMNPGVAPLHNLAAALCAATDSPAGVPALERAIAQDHTQAVIEHLDARLGADANLLLLIDQFEEIFAFRGAEDEEHGPTLGREQRQERTRRRAVAADFMDLVIDLGRRDRLPAYTVLTMRTDFLGDCDLFYGLPEAMNRGRYLVPRLPRRQLRQAIEGPARLSGVQLTPRLVDRILNELGDRTDRLPVLQHALHRTWATWHAQGGAGAIDIDHYEEAGTLEKALSMDAEEAIAECDPGSAARVFKSLTDTDSNHRRVRRPAARREIVAVSGLDRGTVDHVLERFRENGRNFVLLSDGASPGDTRVDISHESLIRQWDRLKDWVDEERDSRDRFVELLRNAGREVAGQASLLRDPELELALDWRETEGPTPAWGKRYSGRDDALDVVMDYLDRSRAAAEAEERKGKRRRLILFWTAAVAVLALAGLWYQAERATLRAKEATSRTTRNYEAVLDAQTVLNRNSYEAFQRLLELEKPYEEDLASRALIVMDQVMQRGLEAILQGHEDVVSAALFGTQGRVVTGSWDTTWAIADTTRHADTGIELQLDRREGHTGAVLAAALSPDGTRVATASSDQTGRVWDAGRGELIVSLVGHTGAVFVARFPPNRNDRVLTASADGSARIWAWEAATAEEVVRFEGHNGPVVAASFSPDGSRVVTASADGTACIWAWQAAVAEEIVRFYGHSGPVVAASFSQDGSRVVTASEDGTARIWNAGNEEAVVMLDGHSGPVVAASFNPDGSRVVTASEDRTARVWNVETGELVFSLDRHTGAVVAASFSPDGARILTASEDTTARIWDAGSGTEIVPLDGHAGAVLAASFSPDGERIVTASSDGTARIWAPVTSRLYPELEPVERLESLLRFYEQRLNQ